jgi:hypothetical protein
MTVIRTGSKGIIEKNKSGKHGWEWSEKRPSAGRGHKKKGWQEGQINGGIGSHTSRDADRH